MFERERDDANPRWHTGSTKHDVSSAPVSFYSLGRLFLVRVRVFFFVFFCLVEFARVGSVWDLQPWNWLVTRAGDVSLTQFTKLFERGFWNGFQKASSQGVADFQSIFAWSRVNLSKSLHFISLQFHRPARNVQTGPDIVAKSDHQILMNETFMLIMFIIIIIT